jgi:hypothetical protein
MNLIGLLSKGLTIRANFKEPSKVYLEKNDAVFEDAVNAWKEAKERLDEAKELEAICRDGLIYLAGDDSCKGFGVSVTKCLKVGNVDYKAIPELKGVDLEKYRKAPIEYWKVS